MVEIFCIVAESDKPIPATTVEELMKASDSIRVSLPTVMRRLKELKKMKLLRSKKILLKLRGVSSYYVNKENLKGIGAFIAENEEALQQHIAVREHLAKIKSQLIP